MITFGLVFAATRLAMAFGVLSIEGHWLAGFTAIAHVYMGVLLHCWWVERPKFETVKQWLYDQPWQWHFFWFMNAVEVFSAIKSRM